MYVYEHRRILTNLDPVGVRVGVSKVANMTHLPLAVLWHDLPEPDSLDPRPDAFDTQNLVTVW